MGKIKRVILTILSIIGLSLAIELCIVYYNANFSLISEPSICSINEMMDCDGVAKTPYSQFLGIPLSYWGVCLYLFFLFMIYVDKIKNIKFLGFLKVFKNPLSYIFCIGLFSFIVSMILGSISILKINAICIFCFMTYFIDLLIAIVSKQAKTSIFDEIKTSIRDFIEAIKVKRYAISFGLIIALFSAILVYTSISNIFSPQIIKQKELKRTLELKNIKIKGNRLGDENAEVQIDEYMDFNCGGCFMAQIYLHRIVNEFENVTVLQHNVPLDAECNPKGGGHRHSCLKARYALAAAKQNKYWHLGQVLFNPEIKEEKDIIEAARLLDLDVKKLKEDANSSQIRNELSESIKEASLRNVNGTPTLFIGMKHYLGVGTYPEFVNKIIAEGGKKKSKNAE